MVVFDSKGGLHKGRDDVKADTAFYRKWEICEATNPKRIDTEAEAFKGADVIIAASKPGPDTIKPEWIQTMAPKSIVFACANPVPEIYPYAAKEAGAYVVATGRGDFPNQVNNSIGFPGILKGALLVRARKITDEMAIAAAHSVADFAEKKKGINPDYIMPTMQETEVFAVEAADVAMQAIKDGVARVELTWDEVYKTTLADIKEARAHHRPAAEERLHQGARPEDARGGPRQSGRGGQVAPTWVLGGAAAARPRRPARLAGRGGMGLELGLRAGHASVPGGVGRPLARCMLMALFFFLLNLRDLLQRVSHRTGRCRPDQVWLNFIPVFNLVWFFSPSSR